MPVAVLARRQLHIVTIDDTAMLIRVGWSLKEMALKHDVAVWNHGSPRETLIEPGFKSTPGALCETLSAADFFAMPSIQEAFALSPMQAMACGLPVVAFPVSGTSELITDLNGIRCRDFSVEALQEGIMTLMSRRYDGAAIR